MAGEENSHYAGKVVKYEDGIVLFRLDQKIRVPRKEMGQKPYSDLRIDGRYFALACGIKEDQIIGGNTYKISRRHVYLLAERIQKVLAARKKGDNQAKRDLSKGNPKETGERTENIGDAFSDEDLAAIFENQESGQGEDGASIDDIIKKEDDED